MNAVAARDWERAKAVADDIAWAVEPHHIITGSPEVFASYNIQMEKLLMEASEVESEVPIKIKDLDQIIDAKMVEEVKRELSQ